MQFIYNYQLLRRTQQSREEAENPHSVIFSKNWDTKELEPSWKIQSMLEAVPGQTSDFSAPLAHLNQLVSEILGLFLLVLAPKINVVRVTAIH